MAGQPLSETDESGRQPKKIAASQPVLESYGFALLDDWGALNSAGRADVPVLKLFDDTDGVTMLPEQLVEWGKEAANWLQENFSNLLRNNPQAIRTVDDIFGKQFGTFHFEAGRVVEAGMTRAEREQMACEREEYQKAVERRVLQLGIGIPCPEPGPAMQEYDRRLTEQIRRS